MAFEDEIRKKALKLNPPPQLIDSSDEIVDEISDSFDWVGSKINWEKTKNHKHLNLTGESDHCLLLIKEFISRDTDINRAISISQGVYYVNDSSIDFSVYVTPPQFSEWLEFAYINIPQHHYFFDATQKWCLVISMEGNVDFGFSNMA